MNKRTVKVKESDFKASEWYVMYNCPYCKSENVLWSIYRHVSKIERCANCLMEFSIESEEEC